MSDETGRGAQKILTHFTLQYSNKYVSNSNKYVWKQIL